MKSFALTLIALTLGAMSPAAAAGMSHPRESGIALEGRINSPYIASRGGRAYLQLTIVTPERGVRERKPVNLCVVLDRSGSMAEQGKIGNAKAALNALIDQLNEDDIFSLVIYDDVVDVLRPACRVEDKAGLRDLVEGIGPRGWTNLGGGMREGFRQVEKHAGGATVNRVVLLSDGLANRGVTDPSHLGRLAREHRGHSVSLTTIGVGLDYNENLMTSLADQGGGNYYFIECAGDLASILRKEFDMLGCVVAQDAVIELKPGRGVRVADVIGGELVAGDGKVRIPVGDLYAGERREFTVELDLPGGIGREVVASGVLRYDPAGVIAGGSFSASVTYTGDAAEIDHYRDWGAQSKADIAVSTRGVEKAMNALDAGRKDEAVKEIAAARQALRASPSASQAGVGAAVMAQEQRLGVYQERVAESAGDARKAKKAIQYDNYNVQKKK